MVLALGEHNTLANMVHLHSSKLESDVRRWIKTNKKEGQRLEFKKRLELSAGGAKAEFVRDVIGLANSAGESPREDAYLVLGFNEGQVFDVRGEHYDGATFTQIVHSAVFPPLDISYEEFPLRARGPQSSARIGILILKPDPDVVYVVKKRFLDENGRVLLFPGQCWGRKSDQKHELHGEEIKERLDAIMDRRIDSATAPLAERIAELEREGGPTLDVKRIRFEIESTQAWPEIRRHLDRLFPYAKEFEFGFSVKAEVLYAISFATGRTNDGMTVDVAEAVGGLLLELMPLGLGGLVSSAHKEISHQDQKLLKMVEERAWELLWDACRYLRNAEIVKIAGRCYHHLIRFAALNDLHALQTQFLTNAQRGRDICMEDRYGVTFPEGRKILEDLIKDALDLPHPSEAKQGTTHLQWSEPLN